TSILVVENMMCLKDETGSKAMNMDPASDSPLLKCPRLLSCYKAHKNRSPVQDSAVSAMDWRPVRGVPCLPPIDCWR
ncbi:hypothetical protein AMECASPLE_037312, partial [Ameca splendens]